MSNDMNLEENKISVDDLVDKFHSSKFDEVLNLSNLLLKKEPNNYIIYNILGATYSSLQNFKKSITYYKKALKINPNFSHGYNNLGVSYQHINDIDSAMQSYEKSAKLNPKYPGPLYNIANVFFEKKKAERAIEYYQKTIELSPDFLDAYNNMGNCYLSLGRFDESIDCFNKILKINKAYYKAYNNLGQVLNLLGKYQEAEEVLLKGIDVCPKFLEFYVTLGHSYISNYDLLKCIKIYKKGFKRDNNNPVILNNIGHYYMTRKKYKIAEKYFKKAKLIKKDYNDVTRNLALCQLATKNFKEGWKNYSLRFECDDVLTPQYLPKCKKYNLKDTFKRVYIWTEQGLGDEIFFSRFLNNLNTDKTEFFFRPQIKLIPLFRNCFPNLNILDSKVDPGGFSAKNDLNEFNFDGHIAIGSLAELFAKDEKKVRASSKKFLNLSNPVKLTIEDQIPEKNLVCGISWFTKTLSSKVSLKMYKTFLSTTLNDLRKILKIKNISFIDLQYGNTAIEKHNFFKNNGVKIIKDENIDNFNDFVGLSSLIERCDFVISVSNSIAHLSSALGKKTYLMLPGGKGKMWYWDADENKSLWYEKMKIFIQKEPGCWKYVIDEIYKDINNSFF